MKKTKNMKKIVGGVIGAILVAGVSAFGGYTTGISQMQPKIQNLQDEITAQDQIYSDSITSFKEQITNLEGDVAELTEDNEDLQATLDALRKEYGQIIDDYEQAIFEQNVENFNIQYFYDNIDDVPETYNGTEYDENDIKLIELYDVDTHAIDEDEFEWQTSFKIDMRYGNEDIGFEYVTYNVVIQSYKDEKVADMVFY